MFFFSYVFSALFYSPPNIHYYILFILSHFILIVNQESFFENFCKIYIKFYRYRSVDPGAGEETFVWDYSRSGRRWVYWDRKQGECRRRCGKRGHFSVFTDRNIRIFFKELHALFIKLPKRLSVAQNNSALFRIADSLFWKICGYYDLWRRMRDRRYDRKCPGRSKKTWQCTVNNTRMIRWQKLDLKKPDMW